MATISGVINSVKSWVSNNLTKYLPLDGGKMTGTIAYVSNNLSIGTNPTSSHYKAIHWTDKTGETGNNNRLATVEYSCNTSGEASIIIGPYTYIANRGSFNGSILDLRIKSNGEKSITWDGKPVVCVESWRSGYNWYRKYSDGFLEQGGTFGANNGGWTDATFSFPKAFSNTNYNLFVQGNWSDPNSSSCLVHARSASSVTVRHANNYYSTMPSYFVAYGT